jgi:hypothetical protein
MSAQERHKGVRKLRVNNGRSLVLAGSSDLTERAYLISFVNNSDQTERVNKEANKSDGD